MVGGVCEQRTTLKSGLNNPGARSESDVSGGGLSIRIPSMRVLRGEYPPISIRRPASESLQAGDTSRRHGASPGAARLVSEGKERLRGKVDGSVEAVEIVESVVDWDKSEGVLSVVCENNISSSMYCEGVGSDKLWSDNSNTSSSSGAFNIRFPCRLWRTSPKESLFPEETFSGTSELSNPPGGCASSPVGEPWLTPGIGKCSKQLAIEPERLRERFPTTFSKSPK